MANLRRITVEEKPKERKAPPNAKITTIGPPPERRPRMVVRAPYATAYKEDLQWAENFIDARLYEIDLQFGPTSCVNRPLDGRGCTFFERELAAEERELKCLRGEIAFQVEKAPKANDSAARKARLDAMVDEQKAARIFQIGNFERQAEFREARLRRLLLPELRIELRKQFFRYGG